MDRGSPLQWPGQLQEESLIPLNDDEFANLLDFGFQLPDFDSHGHDQLQAIRSPANDNGMVRMDTDLPYHHHMPHDLSIEGYGNEHGQPSDQIHPTYSNADIPPGYYGEPPQRQHLNEQSIQPQSHQASHKQTTGQNYGRAVIPPTPNSIELQGHAAREPHRLDESNELWDRYSRPNEEQVGDVAVICYIF